MFKTNNIVTRCAYIQCTQLLSFFTNIMQCRRVCKCDEIYASTLPVKYFGNGQYPGAVSEISGNWSCLDQNTLIE